MNIQAQTLQKLNNIVKQNSEICCVWLYGSRARGLARPDSDYDLAVLFSSYIGDPLERRLRPEVLALEWSQLVNEAISVVDICQAPLFLAVTVLNDNTPIYIADYDAKLQQENTIMSKWEHDGERYRATSADSILS